MNKLPAFQFYTGDWLKDPALSMCSPATRGIWMDILCAAHELARSGQITGTPDQLARICRCTAADLIAAVNELQATGTADVRERRGVYTITNRRMRRAWLEKEDARARQQKRRGNGSNLPEIRAEKAELKLSKSDAVADLSQTATEEMIEDLGYVTEPSLDCHGDVTPYSSSSSSSSLNTHEIHEAININQGEGVFLATQAEGPPRKPNAPTKQTKGDNLKPQVQEIFAYWQVKLNHAKAKLTPARHRCIEGRLKEGYTMEDLRQAVDGCAASPWHMGGNPDGQIFDDIELICRNGQKVEMFQAKLGPRNGTGGPHAKPAIQAKNEAAFDEAYEILFGSEPPAPPAYIDAEVLS